jgi:flagellar FliL protein
MADNQAEAAAGTAPAAKRGGMGGKLVVAGFMAGVVGLECIVAYFMFPSPEEVAALAERNIQKTLPTAVDAHPDDPNQAMLEPVEEVDLGEYSVTVTQPNGASALRVDFHLFGTAPEKETEHVKTLVERHINRFRDLVLFEIRNSSPNDLADPGLALIKRRILEKSNTLFGSPLLKSIVFSQFSYFEQ